MDLRSERIGGWGALLQGGLTLAAFAAGLALIMAERAGRPTALGPALAAALVAVASGLAELAAVRGLRFALRPSSRVARSWVVWAATWAGWAGAAVLILGGLVGLYGLLAGRPAAALTARLAEIAPLLTAVWAVAGCAAAWRAGRLPGWLKVTGVVWGAAVLGAPALAPLRLVALAAGLAWWFGLGRELLRQGRAAG